MRRFLSPAVLVRLAPLTGCLLATGCLARATQNLDTLLSPNAIGLAQGAPYSAVWPLMRFLLGLGVY